MRSGGFRNSGNGIDVKVCDNSDSRRLPCSCDDVKLAPSGRSQFVNARSFRSAEIQRPSFSELVRPGQPPQRIPYRKEFDKRHQRVYSHRRSERQVDVLHRQRPARWKDVLLPFTGLQTKFYFSVLSGCFRNDCDSCRADRLGGFRGGVQPDES